MIHNYERTYSDSLDDISCRYPLHETGYSIKRRRRPLRRGRKCCSYRFVDISLAISIPSSRFHSFSFIFMYFHVSPLFPFHFHSHFQCTPRLDPNQSINCCSGLSKRSSLYQRTKLLAEPSWSFRISSLSTCARKKKREKKKNKTEEKQKKQEKKTP